MEIRIDIKNDVTDEGFITSQIDTAPKRQTYLEAQEKAAKTLKEYLASFEKKDKEKKKLVKEGKMTEKEYRSWRRLQVMTGKRYASVLEQVAWGYEHANEVAAAAIEGKLPEIYAENANFAAFNVCQNAGMAIAFDLVSAEAVQRSIMEGADLFPRPSVNAAKDVAWNRKLLSSQLTQGLLLGESMQKIARRIQNVTNSNYATAIRTARTTVTAAENAGRVDSYQHAKDIGVAVKQQWLATIDGRTRHSHRQLDGEVVEVGEEFSNGCKFPGDPDGAYSETMNCRCTLVPWFDDDEDISDLTHRFNRLPEGMTYEQWKAEGLTRKKLTAETYTRLANAADSLLADIERMDARGRVVSGAVSGALNSSNDPSGKKRRKHAKAYYEEIRNRDKASEVAAVAKNAGVGVDMVSAAYDHLFINLHELDAGLKRFDEDFEIAMSWQRMREGSRIERHDTTLLYHEAYEAKLMEDGFSYSQAHEKAQKVYNYSSQVNDYLSERGKTDGVR